MIHVNASEKKKFSGGTGGILDLPRTSCNPPLGKKGRKNTRSRLRILQNQKENVGRENLFANK